MQQVEVCGIKTISSQLKRAEFRLRNRRIHLLSKNQHPKDSDRSGSETYRIFKDFSGRKHQPGIGPILGIKNLRRAMCMADFPVVSYDTVAIKETLDQRQGVQHHESRYGR